MTHEIKYSQTMILIHPSLLNSLINTILIHLGPGAREVLGKPITCILSRDKMWWKNNRLKMSVHVFVYQPRLSFSMSTIYWEQFVQSNMLNKLTQWGWRHSSVSWLSKRDKHKTQRQTAMAHCLRETAATSRKQKEAMLRFKDSALSLLNHCVLVSHAE